MQATKEDSAPSEAPTSQNKLTGNPRRVLAANQEVPAHIYHQKVLHDPKALHAEGLGELPSAKDAEYWIRKASGLAPKEAENVLLEALQRDAQPVTSIARALHELHKMVENSPAPPDFSAAAARTNPVFSASKPESVPRSLTPSRTGLTGKALRVPSRLAKTPGAAGADAAVPPPTKFHGILKKLQFSSAAGDKPGPSETLPQTTTKRLQFEGVHETPVASTFPGSLKASARRVTFGADTASPSHQRPRRSSIVAFQTPSAIAEGGSGDEEDAEADGATVNSCNAGATPFDRRLSFANKYSEQKGTEERETPDLWKKLSSVSPSDSIRGLTSAQKPSKPECMLSSVEEERSDGMGSSDNMSLANSTPVEVVAAIAPEHGPAAPANAAAVEKEQQPEAAVENKNNAETPNTAIASVLGVLLRRSLEDIEAAKAAEASAEKRYLLSGAISPTTGVLSVVPSPLSLPKKTPARNFSEEEEEEEEEPATDSLSADQDACFEEVGAEQHQSSSLVTDSPELDTGATSDIDLSPDVTMSAASVSITSSLPPTSRTSVYGASLSPLSPDGVPRDEQGVPLVTPGTVTLFRGAASHVPRRDDGIAADLFRTFATPESPAGGELASLQSFEGRTSFSVDQDEEEHKSTGKEEEEFEFSLPVAAASGATPGAEAMGTEALSEEGTPDFMPKSATKSAVKTEPSITPVRSYTPSSVAKSLGKAQRILSPAPEAAASDSATGPQSTTKELRGLLEGIKLSSPAPAAPAAGGSAKAPKEATPARRSARLASKTPEPVVLKPDEDVAEKMAALELQQSSSVNEGASQDEEAADEEEQTPSPVLQPVPQPRYSLRSASKIPRPSTAVAMATPTAAAPAAGKSARKTRATTTGKKPSPGSADRELKLSPTEMNIRNSLRRSSRRKSTVN